MSTTPLTLTFSKLVVRANGSVTKELKNLKSEDSAFK